MVYQGFGLKMDGVERLSLDDIQFWLRVGYDRTDARELGHRIVHDLDTEQGIDDGEMR